MLVRMDTQVVLLTSCVVVIALIIFTIIFSITTVLLHNWTSIRSTKLVWRNKYPSFEELHALFDRGDIMLSTILIASTLQLSYPKLSKALQAHSTYKNDPWRRLIRTTAFIYIMIRANSSERQFVITWLRKLHGSIPLFAFETNVLVFATFAYGLVKTHEFLGNLTPEQVDGIVKGVMIMADKLDPRDKGRKVPSTMAEVEEYLRRELSFDTDGILKIHQETRKLSGLREDMKKQGIGKFLRMPFTSLKFLFLRRFVWTLSTDVLAQNNRSRNIFGRSL